MAKALELDVQDHEEFHWLIRDCLLAMQEAGWRIRREYGGDVAFVRGDGVTAERAPRHKIVEAHKELGLRLKAQVEDLKLKRLDPRYRVRELVYFAIMGEKDIRGVCTPQLIEDIMDNLEVNAHDEPYLVARVKVAIEDCYFRMKKLGPSNVTIENCIDVESLMVNLELDRVGFMKKISPSGLLYCVECQTSLADVISAGSHDVFCNVCAAEIHCSGNRQDVPLVFFEQSVCVECTEQSAIVRCQDCVDNFCYDCYKATHKRGKRQRHCVSLACRTFCSECDEHEAAYICVETEDVLCTKCAARIHRSGARQNHTLFGLRKAAYNKKLFGDNLDQLMGVMEKYIQRQYPLSPWFIFYDSALAPYWYNFETRRKVPGNSNNLVDPPIDEPEDGEDNGGRLSADEQMVRPLPGATRVHDTHAAQFASQAACFEVPPPMYLKFVSPLR